MNFIIRNLGWILLIIFFIFMLYLISNQDNSKKIEKPNITETGSTVIQSNKNESNKKLAIQNYNSEKENILNVIEPEIEKGILNTISDFFSSDNNQDTKIILNNKNDFINKETKKVKTIQEKISEKIKKRNKKITHIVWVEMIALNNPYFTKRIWYAYKGDKLEQITNINKYGCFNSTILESNKSKWLKWWTCIYYMEWHLDKMNEYTKESIKYYKKLREKRISKTIVQNKIKISNEEKKVYKAEDGSTIIIKDPHRVYEGPIYNTPVWSLYLVRVNSLKLQNSTFIEKKSLLKPCTSKKCDILEQLTPIDNKWCFKVKVFNLKNNDKQKGWVCQKYLR